MFKNIYQNLQIDSKNLFCVKYELMDANSQRQCVHLFPPHNFNDDYVVFLGQEDCRILGYINVVENNITHSVHFSNLANVSKLIDGTDAYEMSKAKSFQITEWVFDVGLQNEDLLKQIFCIITYDLGMKNETVILWQNGDTELEFYPITNHEMIFPNYSLGAYFAEKILNNKQQQP